ncbi:MAG: MBL fold metallo-hydrolase [Burkholderiales bacterium]|nr:MBL fold metallo-hydrolase [Burkholderiales bacterium]ODU66762.1 MAG: hypothetical protein ABT05_04740 [Lautropia sp. SCN 66-9]
MNTWRVGSVRVTRIEEQLGVGGFSPENFLLGFDREVFRKLLPVFPNHYSAEKDRLVSSMHSWLLRVGGKRILIDACCGNHKERPWMPRFHQLNTRFMENLRDAGAAPEDIDIVMCTHLHSDHVGWNTRLENGRWVPTFPNARYVYSDKEDAAFNPARAAGLDPNRAIVYNDSVLPVVQAGQAQVLSDGIHELAAGLVVEPSPGHTPGHVALKLEDGGQRGLFCGDALHHAVQVFRPDWNSAFCMDPDQARITRRSLLSHCADQNALLFPAHFAAPYVAAIHREGEGFGLRFVPATAP